MARVHLVMQGKGGVGKTFSATVLAQYLKAKGREVLCVDTDPVNATFAGFKELGATRLDLLEDESIAPRRFDQLIELIESATDEVVVDNGASSFIAFAHYLTSNDVPSLLASMNHTLFVHVPITGGQAIGDCAENLRGLANSLTDDAKLVVWLNPFFAPVEYRGKTFEETKIYDETKDRVVAIVKLPTFPADTVGLDLSEMLAERITFDQALDDPERPIMVRQRLKLTRQKLFGQLDAATVI